MHERLRTAWWALGVLIGMEDPPEQDSEDNEDPADEPTPAGPLRSIPCTVEPRDRAAVKGLRDTKYGDVVALIIRQGGELRQILATPSTARSFAAGILDAAAEVDGIDAPMWITPDYATEEGDDE